MKIQATTLAYTKALYVRVQPKSRLSFWWIGVTLLILIISWKNLRQLTSDLCYLAARQMFTAGYEQSALWLATQSQHIQTDQPFAYNLAGYILFHIKDIPASKEQLEAGVRYSSSHSSILNNLAVLNYVQQNNRNAIAFQLQAAAMAPDTAIPHYNLGVLSWQRGDSIAAIRALREATRISPNWVTPYHFLASIYLSKENYGAVEELSKRSIALQPDQSIGHELYIQALLAQQKGETAHKAISAAERFITNKDRLYLYYALAMHATGKIDISKLMLEKLFMWTDDRILRHRVMIELRAMEKP